MDAQAGTTPAGPRRRPSMIPLGIMGLILVAGLVMLGRNWIGWPLSDDKLQRYLDPGASEGDTRHALEEMSRRIIKNDPNRKRFYPQIIALAASPSAEKRKAVAWVMGEDATEPSFREPLLKLLEDPVPLVTHNAALALARHGSDAARPILLSMLRPVTVTAPADGVFHPKVRINETAGLHTPLGTIQSAQGEVIVDPSVPGRVLSIASDGAKLSRGDPIATLGAAQSIAYPALRALTLPGIGRPEDAAVVDAFLKATPDLDKKVEDQAREALLALERGK